MTTQDFYHNDGLSAMDARFEAQKIAFAPYIFQAARAMIDLGVLASLSRCGDKGLSLEEIEAECGISEYGARILTEAGLGIGAIKLNDEDRFVIGKIGCFLADDALTRINIDFMQDICYEGAAKLEESIQTGKPCGLKAFGENWNTIYEALSSLPERAKRSWFAFDHNYSDNIFPEVLDIVFDRHVAELYDIGGNTARFAMTCARHDKDVHVTIIDLPGQCRMAQENIAANGLEQRISTHAANMLEPTGLPSHADVIWMSQFLDCFSPEEITSISRKVASAATDSTRIFVLEPLTDHQKHLAATFCLQQTSLYFTTMANGNSKMYSFAEIVPAIEAGGLRYVGSHQNLGIYSYTLLEFRKRDEN